MALTRKIMIINVTKPYLPDLELYTEYLRGIWERNWLTNRGPLVIELEEKLKRHLALNHLLFVSNGTIALQIAIKALELRGEIITTPFSYVATTTSILWEHCIPVFADIEPKTFCIDPEQIEARITETTSAILATHVYGYPCQVEAIERLAKKYKLKVIYDAAHAFGVRYKNRSIFSYGDISTCSFHATKVFHTVEGGAVISNLPELTEKIFLYHTFGHIGDDYYMMGINAKNSELHAAMGLCNLPQIPGIISEREKISAMYDVLLAPSALEKPVLSADVEYNFAYYPILLKDETRLLEVSTALAKEGINTRRYFYPSLNTLGYLTEKYPCPVSENISGRILCLPLYAGLKEEQIIKITGIINKFCDGR